MTYCYHETQDLRVLNFNILEEGLNGDTVMLDIQCDICDKKWSTLAYMNQV